MTYVIGSGDGIVTFIEVRRVVIFKIIEIHLVFFPGAIVTTVIFVGVRKRKRSIGVAILMGHRKIREAGLTCKFEFAPAG